MHNSPQSYETDAVRFAFGVGQTERKCQMPRKTTAVAAALVLILCASANATQLISCDWAWLFAGGSLSWGGQYSVGDQWVDDVEGEWRTNVPGSMWQGPFGAAWGGHYWQVDTTTTETTVYCRGVLTYRDLGGGGPFTDVSNIRLAM
jgi:hypothetical protein